MLEDSGGYLFQKLVEKIRMTSCGDEIWAIAKFVNMKMLHVLGLGLLKNVNPTGMSNFFLGIRSPEVLSSQFTCCI